MILIMILVLGAAWLLAAWSTMIVVGMVHHEILHAVIPISYTTSLKFAAVTLGFAVLGVILREALESLK